MFRTSCRNLPRVLCSPCLLFRGGSVADVADVVDEKEKGASVFHDRGRRGSRRQFSITSGPFSDVVVSSVSTMRALSYLCICTFTPAVYLLNTRAIFSGYKSFRATYHTTASRRPVCLFAFVVLGLCPPPPAPPSPSRLLRACIFVVLMVKAFSIDDGVLLPFCLAPRGVFCARVSVFNLSWWRFPPR